MFRNWWFKNAWLFFLMGWIPLFGACTQTMDATESSAAVGKESTANTKKSVVPIDAAIPDEFETASFGLG